MRNGSPVAATWSSAMRLWLYLGLIAIHSGLICRAQELEPRRWSHLPVGVNFAGGGYAFTSGDIAFDPVTRLENVKLRMHSIPLKYIRTFAIADRQARIEWLQAYQESRWSGLLDGSPASTERRGLSDAYLRVAVNLIGAPALRGDEFKKYRAKVREETIFGVGLVVRLPIGQYFEERLLNLGANRFTFRPQIGGVHRHGKWSTEMTIASWIYTDNDDFFGSNTLEQDPIYAFQGYVYYTFRPGFSLGAGSGYGEGGRSTINGVRQNDYKRTLGWLVSLDYPLSPTFGVNVTYIGRDALSRVGVDSNSVVGALSVLW